MKAVAGFLSENQDSHQKERTCKVRPFADRRFFSATAYRNGGEIRNNHVTSRKMRTLGRYFRLSCFLLVATPYCISSTYAEDSLRNEARTLVQNALEEKLIKFDGKNYFSLRVFNEGSSNERRYLYQLSGVSVDIKESQISLADKLNGITWLGSLTVSVQAHRSIELKGNGDTGKWHEWQGEMTESPVGMRKINDQWQTESDLRLAINNLSELQLPSKEEISSGLANPTKVEEKWKPFPR